MPPLKNPRHERFARALFEGESATDAYKQAGYKPDRKNAARLTTNDGVRARLMELQAAAAKNSEVTVASLLSELEDARQKASNLDQLSAAVRAIEAKAKVSGLLVQRFEVGGAGAFDSCDTPEQVADMLLDRMSAEQFRPVTDEDRRGLTGLLLRHNAEAQEFISAIKARPVQAVRVHDPAEARRRLGLLGNVRS